MLRRFYDKTKEDRKRWARLFNYVGLLLRNDGEPMKIALLDRFKAYFDWRFKVGEPLELQKFTFWLDAECLEPEWRLRSYSKILNHNRGKGEEFYSEMIALNKFLPSHLALVVECFAKITDVVARNPQTYISDKEGKAILEAGTNAKDPQIRENVKRARENLLKAGHLDHLD